MIGHWMFGAPFTATSMIGFVALAGHHRAQLDPDRCRELRDLQFHTAWQYRGKK
jgi:hypothetical protein